MDTIQSQASTAELPRQVDVTTGGANEQHIPDFEMPPDTVDTSGAATVLRPADDQEERTHAGCSSNVTSLHMADASEGKPYSFAYLCSMTLGVLLLPGGLFLLPIFQPNTGSQEDDGGGSGRQPEQNDSDQFARRAGSMCASQPRVFDRHMAVRI
ncbi:uncharacterized protein LOC142767892 [Rhipicephalus microplus]|uniref:uncharacterized protein LOC142767892 n=1 Tax=Rhipicephalus microplus TaxID=6941 RepID=UPI003F6CD0BC